MKLESCPACTASLQTLSITGFSSSFKNLGEIAGEKMLVMFFFLLKLSAILAKKTFSLGVLRKPCKWNNLLNNC